MNKQALSLAMLVAGAYPAVSNALSLGDIESNSNLNQPLRAKIELLSTSPQEAQQLQVRLAPNNVFNRVGVDRPAFLNNLRFNSTVQNGKPVILVTSDTPISEPFVNFLLEVSWPNGQLLKEYTVMLDPPVLMQPGNALAGNEAAVRAEPRSSGIVNRPAPQTSASPQVTAAQQARQREQQAQQRAREQQQAQQRAQQQAQQRAREQQAQQRAQQQAQQRARQQQQAQQRAARQQQPQRSGNRTYRVRRGDTLYEIANRMRRPGVNVDQMMIALYRANPSAFINNNMNGLKAGAVLRTPSLSAAQNTSRTQAKRQVRQQYAEWKKFRERLAQNTVPQRTASNNTSSGSPRSDGDSDNARLEVLGKTNEASTDTGSSAAGSAEEMEKLEQELALARESLVTRQRENDELKSRVTELESMLRKKNRLIALRDDQLAQLQARLAEAQGETPSTNNFSGSNAGNNDRVLPQNQAATGAGANTDINDNDTGNNVNQNAVSQNQAGTGADNNTGSNVNQNVVPRTEGEVRPDDRDIQNQVASATQDQGNRIVRAQQPDSREPANNSLSNNLNQETPPVQQDAGATDNNLRSEMPVNEEETESLSPFADDQGSGNDLMSLLSSPLAWKIGAGALFALLLLWLLSRLLGRKNTRKRQSPVVADEPQAFNEADADSFAAAHEDQPFRELEQELDKAEQIDNDPFGVATADEFKPVADDPDPGIVEAEVSEEDEVLMEANVYIAYGLHQQAESELKKALEKHPERLDYRHKLLENYFASNNREAFDREAEEFLATAGADRNSKMWHEIAEWGRKISPDNNLYTESDGGGIGAAVAAGAAALGAGAASVAAMAGDDEADRATGAESQHAQVNETGLGAGIETDTDVDQALNDLNDGDELGLDDFDFDLSELENELGQVDGLDDELGTVSGSLNSVTDDTHAEPGHAQEFAQTPDDDLDFSLDDLMGELQQEGEAGQQANAALTGVDDNTASETDLSDDLDLLDDSVNVDDLLSGTPDAEHRTEHLPEHQSEEDGDDGISLMGGLAAGAAAAAGATAAAVISGKDKVVDTLSEAGDVVDNNLDSLNQDVDEALNFDVPELPDASDMPATSDNASEPAEPVDASLDALDLDFDNAAEQGVREAASAVADEADQAADNVTNLNLHLDKESGLKKILPEDTFYTAEEEQMAAESDNPDDEWLGDIDDALSFLDMPDDEIDLHEAHISTKLDLARAYLDMGDVEGARSTLEEVMVEGNDSQRQEAETLLHETG